MTPSEARDFYYEARLRAMNKRQDEYKQPIVQDECDLEAWRETISRIENELTLQLMDARAFSPRDSDRTPDGHQGQH